MSFDGEGAAFAVDIWRCDNLRYGISESFGGCRGCRICDQGVIENGDLGAVGVGDVRVEGQDVAGVEFAQGGVSGALIGAGGAQGLEDLLDIAAAVGDDINQALDLGVGEVRGLAEAGAVPVCVAAFLGDRGMIFTDE